MAARKGKCYSGIGGQAVLEGVMMRNCSQYAVAVRKPDGEIAVDVESYRWGLRGNSLKRLPIIRGIFSFIDSLVVGMKVLNYSASFYEEDEEETKFDRAMKKLLGKRAEKIITSFVMLLAVAIAIGVFIIAPYLICCLFEKFIRNASLMMILEGCIRIVFFLLYAGGISRIKDIRRVYQYHGAEHKCINCIERGRPLNVGNVMRSSRLHRRCGTSFVFFVLIVSIALFSLIRVSSVWERVFCRILLMPMVAGFSYEIIRLAGYHDNILIRIISAPGMLIQRLTTKEPDKDMVEVAIASVEAVFDWRQYLRENFGYEEEEGD